MGGDIIPMLVAAGQAHVYDFAHNEVPGATERDRGYWRDVGTLDSYYDASMDLVSVHPVFNLYNREWPIYTAGSPAAAGQVRLRGRQAAPGHALDSIVSAGVIVSGGTVRRSVLSPGVLVEAGALVEDSVIMHDVVIGAGAVVRRAIIDKNVRRPRRVPGSAPNPSRRPQRFTVSDNGVVVIGKGDEGPVIAGRRSALLTREFPPEVYGGAGVHVEYLSRELARRWSTSAVHCFGAPRSSPTGRAAPTSPWDELPADGDAARPPAPCRSTCGWRPTSAASTWSTATPGTPTSPGTWPSCSTASPT